MPPRKRNSLPGRAVRPTAIFVLATRWDGANDKEKLLVLESLGYKVYSVGRERWKDDSQTEFALTHEPLHIDADFKAKIGKQLISKIQKEVKDGKKVIAILDYAWMEPNYYRDAYGLNWFNTKVQTLFEHGVSEILLPRDIWGVMDIMIANSTDSDLIIRDVADDTNPLFVASNRLVARTKKEHPDEYKSLYNKLNNSTKQGSRFVRVTSTKKRIIQKPVKDQKIKKPVKVVPLESSGDDDSSSSESSSSSEDEGDEDEDAMDEFLNSPFVQRKKPSVMTPQPHKPIPTGATLRPTRRSGIKNTQTLIPPPSQDPFAFDSSNEEEEEEEEEEEDRNNDVIITEQDEELKHEGGTDEEEFNDADFDDINETLEENAFPPANDPESEDVDEVDESDASDISDNDDIIDGIRELDITDAKQNLISGPRIRALIRVIASNYNVPLFSHRVFTMEDSFVQSVNSQLLKWLHMVMGNIAFTYGNATKQHEKGNIACNHKTLRLDVLQNAVEITNSSMVFVDHILASLALRNCVKYVTLYAALKKYSCSHRIAKNALDFMRDVLFACVFKILLSTMKTKEAKGSTVFDLCDPV